VTACLLEGSRAVAASWRGRKTRRAAWTTLKTRESDLETAVLMIEGTYILAARGEA